MTSPLAAYLAVASDATDVLELGTKRSRPDRPTHHRDWHPNAAGFVMADFDDGLDVDVVTDAHDLGFADGSFDAVIACSVFEHLARPWVVVPELARVLRPGGVCIVQTHQTFPLHAYPHDYWRFSTDALRVLFDGWDVLAVDYEMPTRIVPDVTPTVWTAGAPAWLLVSIAARKG